MIEWSIVRYELSVADKFEQFVGYFCKAWLPPNVADAMDPGHILLDWHAWVDQGLVAPFNPSMRAHYAGRNLDYAGFGKVKPGGVYLDNDGVPARSPAEVY